MLEYFQEQKPIIHKELQSYLSGKGQYFSRVNPWGKDFLRRLRGFAGRGKMIRGGLVLLLYEMFQDNRGEERCRIPVQVAAAVELIHAAFLIHDDIIDQDQLRRGKKTIYYQYQEQGRGQGLAKAQEYGRSMGICAGDLVFFLAWDILNNLDTSPEMCRRLVNQVTRETYLVGLAQMQDIYMGHFSRDVTEEDIISVFRHKTARYTFSLPFYLGAALAKKDGPRLETLSEIGENLGIIFQIKDDELGLLGEKEDTGKPLGSDLKGAKKTLFHLYLAQVAGEADRERLRGIMGNQYISREDILWVRSLAHSLGTLDRVHRKMEEIADKTRILIGSLEEPPGNQKILLDLLEYSLNRAC